MALYDTNNNLTSDPYSLCESMGQCLTALGGPPDFQIEPQLIKSLMELCPSIPQDAPHPNFTETFFNTLPSKSNPVKAPGFDNTNLYLFHLAPKHIKSLLFHICSHFITNPIPKQWLTARIFLLYKKHDPYNPVNYRPIALLQTKYSPYMPPPLSPFTPPNTTYSTTPNTVAPAITAPQTTSSP